MKRISCILLILLICLLGKTQENLIPNGDFEDYTPGVPDANDIPNFNAITRNNPIIPCYRGFFETNQVPSWTSFGHINHDSNAYAPSLFDSRFDCNDPNAFDCSNTCCDYNGETSVGIPRNYFENNPGHPCPGIFQQIGDNLSQYHRKQIDFNTIESEHPVIGRYVGLETKLGQNPGIYCKLKKPLKCGFTYTLRFYAVKKSPGNGSDKLQIRLCTNDDWNDYAYLDGNPNKKELHSWITQRGGINHDQWEEETFDFYVSEPNVEYLFIRCGGGNVKVLLDDIEILDQCEIDFACDATLGASTDEITTNGFHNMNQPLTFINTQSSKNIKIQIFPLFQYTPIRTIEIADPGPNIGWDGKNDAGVIVANTYYRYAITYGSACSCRFSEGTFIKNGDPGLFTVSGIDGANGVLTFHNLEDVYNFKLEIYNTNNQLVYIKELINPPNSIYWNGLNDLGLPLGASGTLGCNNATAFKYNLEVSNNCYTQKYEDVPFVQTCYGNIPNYLSNFDYPPQSKPLIECEYSFDYTPYAKAPIACCGEEIDLFLEDVIISGIQEFKLIHDIQAGPKVVIATNSDIKFLAGHEIRLVQDFVTEPGAEFLARIETCTHMLSEDGPIIEVGSWSNFPEVTIEKTTLVVSDSINKLNVYPNPVSSDLFVQSEIGISSIEVFDLTGKMISYEYFSNSILIKLDASALFNGVYILQITLEDGKVETKKVIKN